MQGKLLTDWRCAGLRCSDTDHYALDEPPLSSTMESTAIEYTGRINAFVNLSRMKSQRESFAECQD